MIFGSSRALVKTKKEMKKFPRANQEKIRLKV
jgi:hypothetical protein